MRPPTRCAAGAGLLFLLACGGSESVSNNPPPGPPDHTPPAVTLSLGLAVLNHPGKVTVTIDARDSSGIAMVLVGRQKIGTDPVPVVIDSLTAPPYTIDYPAAGFTEADSGQYDFVAFVTDSAGNQTTTQPVYLLVDMTPPHVVLLPTSRRMTFPGHLDLQSASDELTTHAEFYDGATRIGEVNGPVIPKVFRWNIELADSGVHRLTARERDDAGNVGTSDTVLVTVDIRWTWTRLLGGPLGDGATALAPAPSGGVYLTGPSAGGPASLLDAFVARYDSSGNRLWSHQVTHSTGPGGGSGSVAVEPDGDAVVGAVQDSAGGFPNQDVMVQRYRPDGSLRWEWTLHSPAGEAGGFVATDGSGNVYVAGSTLGSVDTVPNIGQWDYFVVKLDPDGHELWRRQFGSAPIGGLAFDQVTGVAVDQVDGGVYLVGYTDGSADGRPNLGPNDVCVVKYNSDGTRSWVRTLGTSGNDESLGPTGAPGGGLYVTGWNYGGLDGGAMSPATEAFLARFDASGGLTWVRQFGSPSYDYATAVTATSQAVYVAGLTDGRLNGEAWQGFTDAFLARFNVQGTLQEVRLLGAAGVDQAWGVAVATDGAVYLSGDTDGDLLGELNQGGADAFVARQRP